MVRCLSKESGKDRSIGRSLCGGSYIVEGFIFGGLLGVFTGVSMEDRLLFDTLLLLLILDGLILLLIGGISLLEMFVECWILEERVAGEGNGG